MKEGPTLIHVVEQTAPSIGNAPACFKELKQTEGQRENLITREFD